MANKHGEQKQAFDPTMTAVNAEGALAAVEKAGPALVDAWVAAKNAEAIAEVAERGTGAARKAARRALNVLRARGVTIPARKRVATLGTDAAETLDAIMLAPDGAGWELFAISARAPSGRCRVALIYLHPTRGVANVQTRQMAQSQLKEHLAKVQSDYAPIKVPLGWARSRIAVARGLHRQRGVPEPLGFTTAAPLLEPFPAEPPPHPFDEEGLELSDEDARDLAARGAELHRIAEFRWWLPSQRAMQELMTAVGGRLAERVTPGEQPSSELVEESLKEEIDRATDRYFSPQAREEVVALLKDSGLSILAREGEQKGLEIAATIKCIEKAGLITDPPHEVPFLRAYFMKAVALAAAQQGGKLNVPMPQTPIADSLRQEDDAPLPDASPSAEPEQDGAVTETPET